MGKKTNFNPEEKRDIVIQSLRADITKSELCREKGIHFSDLTRWTAKFMERGLEGLKEGKVRQSIAPIDPEEFQTLKKERDQLKSTLIDSTIELQLLKKKVG